MPQSWRAYMEAVPYASKGENMLRTVTSANIRTLLFASLVCFFCMCLPAAAENECGSAARISTQIGDVSLSLPSCLPFKFFGVKDSSTDSLSGKPATREAIQGVTIYGSGAEQLFGLPSIAGAHYSAAQLSIKQTSAAGFADTWCELQTFLATQDNPQSTPVLGGSFQSYLTSNRALQPSLIVGSGGNQFFGVPVVLSAIRSAIQAKQRSDPEQQRDYVTYVALTRGVVLVVKFHDEDLTHRTVPEIVTRIEKEVRSWVTSPAPPFTHGDRSFCQNSPRHQ